MAWSITVTLLIAVGIALAIAVSFAYCVLGCNKRSERDMECLVTEFLDISGASNHEKMLFLASKLRENTMTGAFVFVDERDDVSGSVEERQAVYGIAIGYGAAIGSTTPMRQVSYVTKVQSLSCNDAMLDEGYVSQLDRFLRSILPVEDPQSHKAKTYAKPIVDSSLVPVPSDSTDVIF